MTHRNVHACLVHEGRECVIDLVQNLHHLDPSSSILLYDGGSDPNLLRCGFDFARYNAVVHPHPKPMRWGWLHDFALDCIRFAERELPFDTLTIVDSDQLATRAGYSERIERFVAGKSGLGLLGDVHSPADGGPRAPPAQNAWKEMDLWRPLLRRFAEGESKFVHWTFWPSTVFTAEGARELLRFWDSDQQLKDILRRTRIWASEEVILPTLVALLGLGVAKSPCRYDYVKYRVRFSPAQMDAAMDNPDVFWAHPVPRRYDDPLRAHVRRRHGGYARLDEPAPAHEPPLLVAGRIVAEMRAVEGWLSDDEADLLLAAAAKALQSVEARDLVEVGSFCGKATLVLGRVAESRGPEVRVHAVDPLDGVVGSRDGKLERLGPTRQKLDRTLSAAGLAGRVRVVQQRAQEVAWDDRPIALLLVDGLHDYASVAADFRAFSRHLPVGALAAFHDYADYFPGVRLFVDELVRAGGFRRIASAGSLVVLRREREEPAAAVEPVPAAGAAAAPLAFIGRTRPLVSCIMPTADRRRFLPLALRAFLRQDHLARELIVVDDGQDCVRDLIPDDPRVRYLRLDGRHTVGHKRNLACEAARGELILHLDDDDWASPHRVSTQARALFERGGEVCGLAQVLYHQPATGRSYRYVYPAGQRPWVSGNSLCYTRRAWQRTPFADVDVGEDARFVWAESTRAPLPIAEPGLLVAMIHDGNVDTKRTHHSCWQPHPTEEIRALLGADLEDYRTACTPVALAAVP